MKRLLTAIIMLTILVIGLGFYRGWFSLKKSADDSGSNKVNINLTVDPDKVQADTDAVKERASELAGEARESASELGSQKTDSE